VFVRFCGVCLPCQHDAQMDYYGKRLATCSSDRSVKIFDVQASGEPVFVADLKGWVAAMAVCAACVGPCHACCSPRSLPVMACTGYCTLGASADMKALCGRWLGRTQNLGCCWLRARTTGKSSFTGKSSTPGRPFTFTAFMHHQVRGMPR
jgi:hypothetical protein